MAIDSHAPLPVHRVATPVETCNHINAAVRFDNEHQGVGKAAQQRAADISVDDWELQGVGGDAFYFGLDGSSEAQAQAGGFVLIPIARVKEFMARGIGEDSNRGERCAADSGDGYRQGPKLAAGGAAAEDSAFG